MENANMHISNEDRLYFDALMFVAVFANPAAVVEVEAVLDTYRSLISSWILFRVFVQLVTDVVHIQKSGDLFRLLYNTRGRFVLHRINEDEAKFKLCRVNKVESPASCYLGWM